MSDFEIISRKTAVSLGLKTYFTGIPCKNGHISKRYCANGRCADCSLESGRKWRNANPEKSRESSLDWKKKNPEKHLFLMRGWRSKNAEKQRKSVSRWMKSNPDAVRANNARRRCRKEMATPSWLSEEQKEEIRSFYSIAVKLESESGVKHHVDHIIPIKGKLVSGLHVPWNLQVIPAEANLRKSNKTND